MPIQNKQQKKTRSRGRVSATKKLITHNGSFHADDVFACASLSLLLEKKGQKFEIIRTRDKEIIEQGDYVFDVGGIYDSTKNRFDHHQLSFKAKRGNGIPYSSFGLVWKKYGKIICGKEEVKEYIDQLLVEQIDARDNGMDIFKPLTKHIFNYDITSISASFLPVWGEKDSPKYFHNAVKFAKSVIQKEIKQFSALVRARELIQTSYKKSKNKKLLILNKEIPRYLVNVSSSGYKNLLYIVFPDIEKNWKVLAVRKVAGSFQNKKNLPKSWGALSGKDLQKVSGVADATFCHKGLFMAVAKSKQGALKLAELALK